MLKKYFICNSIHKKPPHFKGKLNWIQPPSDNHILISFFTHLKQKLGSINTPSGKIEINLTLKEMTAFINLKNNQSINKQLQDLQYIQNTHSQSNKRSSPWYSQYHTLYAFPTDNKHGHIGVLQSPRNTRTPLFYGLPKIPKRNCPLRPVVSGCDGSSDRL